jgi:hypothetical protein
MYFVIFDILTTASLSQPRLLVFLDVGSLELRKQLSDCIARGQDEASGLDKQTCVDLYCP